MKIQSFKLRLTDEHLEIDQEVINQFLSRVELVESHAEFIPGNPDYWSLLIFYKEKDAMHKSSNKSDKIVIRSESELDPDELEILQYLKDWRLQKSIDLNVAAFMICHNTELISIAKVKPETLEELASIRGFGEVKIEKYGDEIIALLNAVRK